MGKTIIVGTDDDSSTDTAADVHAEHAEEAAEEALDVADNAADLAATAQNIAFDAQGLIDGVATQVSAIGELTSIQFEQLKDGLTIIAESLDNMHAAIEANTTAVQESSSREVIQEVAPIKDDLPDEHKGHFLNRRIGRS